MFAFNSHGTELRRFFRQPITRGAVAVMLLIPLLYGAMYVWAFWDPSEKMADLPVALVNEDAPAQREGQLVDYGSQVTEELLSREDLGWHQVDAATAAAGLNSGRFYFAVTIPADFSANIVSLAGADPRPAQIDVSYDDSNSFLASTLGRSAMAQLQATVRDQISQQAVDELLIGVGDARDGFAKASDGAFSLQAALDEAAGGADQLNVGAADLAAGAARLAAGSQQLAAGTAAASGGAGSALSGANSLHDGLLAYSQAVSLTAQGAQQLNAGAGDLTALQQGLAAMVDPATGAPALASGIDALAGQLTTLGTGVADYATGAGDFATSSGRWVAGATDWQTRAAAATAPKGDLGAGAAALSQGARSVDQGLQASGATLTEVQDALAAGDVNTAQTLLTGLQARTAGLKAVTGQLVDGADRVKGGIGTLHAALDQEGALGAGLSQLATGQQELSTGAGRLAAGAAQLADPQTAQAVNQLQQGAHRLNDGLTAMNAESSTGIPALQSGVHQLNLAFTGDGTAANPGLEPAIQALTSGSASLAGGLAELDGGVQQLDAASQQAEGGAQSLAAGSRSLQEGTGTLAGALPQIGAGSQSLGEQLSQGAAQIPDDPADLQAARSEAIATPVTLNDSHVHQADSWGEGFAPFFIGLALWVGALITWLLLRPLQSRALMTSVSGVRMAWGSLSSALALSLGQVAIMLTVMHFAIGLDAQNWPATIAFVLLTAATFFALQQFFQIALGPAVGKVVVIVLLMVQLASAGGTYPIQTTPAFLQTISPYLPMTYVVSGLREAITGGLETRFWTSALVLAVVFLASLIGSSIGAARKRVWTIPRLHPALSI